MSLFFLLVDICLRSGNIIHKNILCDMKFVFVVGGSYRSVYLNYLSGLSSPDIIVFNSNVLYDFDIDLENNFSGPVSAELLYLNTLFNCPIVVYGTRVKCCKKDKCFIVCTNGKIKIFEQNSDVYLWVKNCYILVGTNRYFSSQAFATISIQDSTQMVNPKQCGISNYFCMDKKSVTLISGGKFYKKFNKCCKFTLKFFKKVV